MLDFKNLPDEALLRAKEIHRPLGPYPGGHSSWWAAVARGEAPDPVRIGGVTAWRWGDVRKYLDTLAGRAE